MVLYYVVHYGGSHQLVLACDASPYGLGGVLLRIMDDRQERPIVYALHILTAVEKN